MLHQIFGEVGVGQLFLGREVICRLAEPMEDVANGISAEDLVVNIPAIAGDGRRITVAGICQTETRFQETDVKSATSTEHTHNTRHRHPVPHSFPKISRKLLYHFASEATPDGSKIASIHATKPLE